MTENKVLIKNLETHYKIFGPPTPEASADQSQREPFLMLHGWGSNSDRWEKVAEMLAQKYLVIVPDLPGFGKSQEPLESWSIDNYVDWLSEFISTLPELHQNFYLAGHSFGGALATKFTIRYNQQVKKLLLISSACIRARTLIRKIWYRIAKMMKIFSILPGYTTLRKSVYKFVLRKSDYPHVSGVMKETYLRVISDDLSHKINFLKVPTIIIWGDKDESTPITEGEFIHHRIQHSTLVIINGADHSPHVKMPETLAQKILENLPG